MRAFASSQHSDIKKKKTTQAGKNFLEVVMEKGGPSITLGIFAQWCVCMLWGATGQRGP